MKKPGCPELARNLCKDPVRKKLIRTHGGWVKLEVKAPESGALKSEYFILVSSKHLQTT